MDIPASTVNDNPSDKRQTELTKLVLGLFNFQKKRDFKDKDVSDILASKVYAYFLPRSTRNFSAKVVYYFLDKLNKKYNHHLRNIFRLNSNYQYPQAYALIIRGLVKLYEVEPSDSLKAEIFELGEVLMGMRQDSFENYGWGQPFDWPSRHIMKAGTPRATVSSQVAMAYLDCYETFKDKRYLKRAESVCRLFIDDFNYTSDADGDFCFSYTTEDNYHIHNASTLAAAVLIRTHYHTREKDYLEYGRKALQFTAKHQNQDGSWYYRASPDKLAYVVDNIHTGFVLDSYIDSKAYWPDDAFPFAQELKAGFEYYIRTFITGKFEPKYRPNRIFPVDIQSCAQILLTLILYNRHCETNAENERLIDGVLDYTLATMYNGKGQFYYRKYANRTDKNSFIRWGDSWMMRAIGEYLYAKADEKNN